jgi:hypothetical protein
MPQQYIAAFATRYYPSRQHQVRTRDIVSYILDSVGYLGVGRTWSWNENKDFHQSRAGCCKENLDKIRI